MAIDKAKGIVCKPMPKYWHDRHALGKIEDDEEREFNRRIVADKKPYFMRYIYPSLMKQYNTYINNTNRNALREFQMTVDEIRAQPYKELTPRQVEFLKYYDMRMPVGVGNCVMNRICRRFELEFDGYLRKKAKELPFDYTVMKSGSSYTSTQYYTIKKLYDDFNRRIQNYSVFASYERISKPDASLETSLMGEEFRKECLSLCSDANVLCDIVLDLCYSKNSTRKFAWSICRDEIINNLLRNNDGRMTYPVIDKEGDIDYGGFRFRLNTKKVEVS